MRKLLIALGISCLTVTPVHASDHSKEQPSDAVPMSVAAPILAASPADAARDAHTPGRVKVGYGRIITNDLIGDGKDRWRTGSVASSRVWAQGWTGTLPSSAGDLLELRFLGQIIAPDRIDRFRPADRPYAGALSVGLHTHFKKGTIEWALGGDVVAIGPQTGLDDFQDGLHGIFGAPRLFPGMLVNQIPDTFRPTLVAEAGKDFVTAGGIRLRPFAEARAGDESLLRIGADITIGGLNDGALLVRDPVSGQRYKAVPPEEEFGGATFVLGADIAHVFDSVYLPESRGYVLNDTRQRVRAGIHWKADTMGFFYGLTWLGREFKAQPEGQFVGSLKLDLRF